MSSEKTMASGRVVNLAALKPKDISLSDLAHHLAQINRFDGASSLPISVAQHSVLVSRALEKDGPRAAMLGLLHDAHKAFIGDITTPVRHLLDADVIRSHATRIDAVIWQAFGLAPPDSMEAEMVAAADRAALVSEWIKAMPSPPPKGTPVRLPWSFMSFERAREAFLTRFHKLAPAIPGLRIPM